MKNLENRQEKIQKIAEDLRIRALEPAKIEAAKMIAEAQREAETIINEAKKQSEESLDTAQKKIKQERSVFESSLSQAAKQSIEALKQSIEKNLFTDQLEILIKNTTSEPTAIVKLINAIVEALKKDGLDTNLSVIIPKAVSVEEINNLLGKQILEKLKEHSVELSDFGGGVKVRLEGKHLTLDMSDKPLKEMLANYVRKDFRKYLFGSV